MAEDLEARVARQFSTLYLTLVSVLVGLVLSDLFSTIHARMTLWPLTMETARTWRQIFGNVLAVLSAWVTYSHLGLLRNRLPTIWDTVDAALVLVTVPLNAATGRHDPTGWFFWAAAYSVLALSAVKINLRQATREPSLSHLPRIGRFGGPYGFLWVGAPGYLGMAVAAHYHLTTPLLELAATATAAVAAVVITILFMREWREAVTFSAPAAPASRTAG
ncbi:MAG TPA: hypothetical protein VIE16_01040 [Phenylobacterium sp.]|jgi:hypothetical protein